MEMTPHEKNIWERADLAYSTAQEAIKQAKNAGTHNKKAADNARYAMLISAVALFIAVLALLR